MKNEQEFCTRLQVWMKYNMRFSFAWEAKFVRGIKYYHNSDKSLTKEMRNLAIAGKQIIHKLSDAGGRGTLFDGFKLYNVEGFLFFSFKATPKKFIRIGVGDYKDLIKNNRFTTKTLLKEYGGVEFELK